MHKKIWSLAWPLMLINLTVPLLGLVDAAVLGHLDSPVYLGAVAISSQMFTFLLWAFGFLRMGTSGLSANAFGKADPDLLSLQLFRPLLLAIGFGLLILGTAYPLWPTALGWMQTPQPLMGDALLYSEIRLLSAPISLCNFVISGWLVGQQRPRLVLGLAVLTNAVNILLDLLLVAVLDWKVAGAAWASVFAEASALMVGLYLTSRMGVWQRLPALLNSLLDLRPLLQLLRLNGNLFLRTLILLLTLAFFVAQGAALGPETVAANALLLNFVLIVANALDGFANAVEALCGEAYGAGHIPRVREWARAGMVWAIGLAVLLTLGFFIFGASLLGRLSDLEGVLAEARRHLPWIWLLPAISVWCFMLDGIFLGTLKAHIMRNAVLFSTFVLFLPAWYLTRELGNHGLWLSLSLFFLGRSAYQGVAYRGLDHRNNW